MRVIIVGGVAGGASAAARIRRLDERAQITIYERTGFVSYANCGLPYFVGGVITDRNELSLQTPESFWQRFRMDVRVRHEVIEIRPEQKTVVVRNLMTGETLEDRYDKLLLSPGAKPTRPNMSGIENGKNFHPSHGGGYFENTSLCPGTKVEECGCDRRRFYRR